MTLAAAWDRLQRLMDEVNALERGSDEVTQFMQRRTTGQLLTDYRAGGLGKGDPNHDVYHRAWARCVWALAMEELERRGITCRP